jgi:hypothetical protein
MNPWGLRRRRQRVPNEQGAFPALTCMARAALGAVARVTATMFDELGSGVRWGVGEPEMGRAAFEKGRGRESSGEREDIRFLNASRNRIPEWLMMTAIKMTTDLTRGIGA